MQRNRTGKPYKKPSNKLVSTGFAQLDSIIGLNNLNSGYLICLASMPGMGKSTFMLDLLLNLAISSGREILYITNEKTEKQIVVSLIQKLYGDDINSKKKRYDSDALNNISSTLSVLSQLNISMISYTESFESIKNTLSVIGKPAAVLIDGFEAISQDFEKDLLMNRSLCKNLNVPIIITMWTQQMQEDHFRPTLSAVYPIVAKLADSVWLLHRDSYFDMGEDKNDNNPNPELIICKNKNGELGTIQLKFDGQTKSFIEQLNTRWDIFRPSGVVYFSC